MNIPQPIPYQGSKRQLASRILSYFPKDISRIVEPFAGSAAITIAAASRYLAVKFWINDAHEPLMALWREIIENPDAISQSYTRLWNAQLGNEREFFDIVRSRFNKSHQPADFLYLLARCVKAAIRYNSKGEFNNTPDNRRKGAQPAEMSYRIEHASLLLRGRTKITAWDYKKVLYKCTESDLVYMDPPYQGVCGNRDQRYLPKIEYDEFCVELEKLNERNIRYVISYDGRTGNKEYGQPMPDSLGLTLIELQAGRSTQATLLGRSDLTYESLYISPNLLPEEIIYREPQMSLW
ncbi:MAG: DNA adenine methylase [Planctomycetes bacterium RBG_13_44_8b]|nr:MAG: DNA adenine methylase [Planctomycetes bacterium RBG_13_44_8b]